MPQRLTQPEPDPGSDELLDACIALVPRLRRAVRRRKTNEVAAVLAAVPDGRTDVMCIALAAMLPTFASVGDLLAWTVEPALDPVLREPAAHGTDAGYREHRLNGTPTCRACVIAHTVTARPKVCRDEFARLLEAGLSHERAAQLSTPAFLRHHDRLEFAA